MEKIGTVCIACFCYAQPEISDSLAFEGRAKADVCII